MVRHGCQGQLPEPRAHPVIVAVGLAILWVIFLGLGLRLDLLAG